MKEEPVNKIFTKGEIEKEMSVLNAVDWGPKDAVLPDTHLVF